MNGTHRPDHQPDPPLDMAAIRARLAARSPEESAARKTGLDALRLGEDAMVLGEQHLADGDLERAREFFAMAARYRAADAEAMLRTADALLEATRDPGITAAMAGTALDGEHADTRTKREHTAYRALETAGLLRGIEDHAARTTAARDRIQAVLTLALTAAAGILSTARTKADEIIADAENRAAHLAVDAEQDVHDDRRSWLLLPNTDFCPDRDGLARVWNIPHRGDDLPLSPALSDRWTGRPHYLPAVLRQVIDAAEARAATGGKLRRSSVTSVTSACTYGRETVFTTVTDADRVLAWHQATRLPMLSEHPAGDDHWRLILSCPTGRLRSRGADLAEVRAALVRCFGNPDAEEVDRSELRLQWELAH
ncbi:hypothetical protein [Saccharothrix xinjiangensis]|uniref:Uncharacterized protein n=1 Tax=Saccharothrix xinjiangensis TaxID=204798 RepID=A0ABV9Y1F9_9PSEU